MHVRPMHDWLVVKLDPTKETTSTGIFIAGGDEQRVRTGTVLRVGPGQWISKTSPSARRPVGVEPGEKVTFFKENLEHKQGKATVRVLEELEEGTGMIRSADILYVF